MDLNKLQSYGGEKFCPQFCFTHAPTRLETLEADLLVDEILLFIYLLRLYSTSAESL